MAESPAKPAFHSPYLRNFGQTKRESLDHSIDLITKMCADTGRPDLGDTDLLDLGCGVRFSQAILTFDLPLKSYTGVDVYGEMIAFLQDTVDDPRFAYVHDDVHNSLYNPDTAVAIADSPLPLAGKYDLICGFSLFTHLAPDDFAAMLERAHAVAADDAWLYFTAYLDELTPGGHGYIDTLLLSLGLDPSAMAPVEERPDYREGNPEVPLQLSLYSRKHALELVEQSPWTLEAVLDPVPYAQHQFICRASPSR
ncbi:MAG: class I SAM-dependent methyltransferase [Acidimicrobiales bacterium]|nr:class I SAM-dependent methyltransferase [Acidimicrobiales bacterium]